MTKWMIYDIKNETKQIISAYAALNGLKIGEALDKIAEELSK